jgi:prepilin-type N-terminal cleavage/methylation domain-containing protein
MMKNEKGFTLLEVLISLLILGIISVGTLGGLTQAARTNYYTNTRETAKNIAETEMEYVKNNPYSLTVYPIYTPSPKPAYWDRYTIQTPLVESVPGGDPNIQKITVTVSYTNIYTGNQDQTVLTDYKANK